MEIDFSTLLSSVISNKHRVSALKSLGVLTVGDALTYYPFRVTDPVPRKPLSDAHIGEQFAFAAQVGSVHIAPMARNGWRVIVTVADRDSPRAAQLVFFSYKKYFVNWISSRLRTGTQIVVCGTPGIFNNTLQFTHPKTLVVRDEDSYDSSDSHGSGDVGNSAGHREGSAHNGTESGEAFDVVSLEEAFRRVTQPLPVYHANARISSERISETITGLLEMVDSTVIPDILPESVRASHHFMHRFEALIEVHRPTTVENFHQAIASLRFTEALISQVSVVQSRAAASHESTVTCPDPTGDSGSSANSGIGDSGNTLTSAFLEHLPFELTAGQKAVMAQIRSDMAGTRPMKRLLQGEVGSGKTIIAILAMLQALDAGHQATFVAPTLVLAQQHYASLNSYFDFFPAEQRPEVLLLIGGLKLAERRKILATAASGVPCIVVATHAAFSKTFLAPNLALAVIDEQHRFGVEQRDALNAKLSQNGTAPHQLVMTATPIPRTAAMTWFGDLDISTLAELPGGRKPISTTIIEEADSTSMVGMLWHLRQRIDAGERVYVVVPRIDDDTSTAAGVGEASDFEEFVDQSESGELGKDNEESEKSPLHSLEEISRRFRALPQFEGIEIATLSGRDDEATKNATMAAFSDGSAPLLVATTVIEVGVDVPQASCIAIFDADRFGLSQLHQLRGRVGRGGTKAWAFLVSRAQPDSVAAQRLQVIASSNDGMQIAQADLDLRGAGDVLGDVQSGGIGASSFKLLRVVKDADVIVEARDVAETLLAKDAGLEKDPELAGAVLDFLRGHEAFITRS